MRRLVRVNANDHFHETSSGPTLLMEPRRALLLRDLVLVPLSSHTTARSLPEHFDRKPDLNSRQALREPPTATSTTLRNRRASHQSHTGDRLDEGRAVVAPDLLQEPVEPHLRRHSCPSRAPKATEGHRSSTRLFDRRAVLRRTRAGATLATAQAMVRTAEGHRSGVQASSE